MQKLLPTVRHYRDYGVTGDWGMLQREVGDNGMETNNRDLETENFRMNTATRESSVRERSGAECNGTRAKLHQV